MKNNKQCLIKWHRNPELSAMVHLIPLFLSSILILAFRTNKVILGIMVFIFVILIFSYIYSYRWGWNSVICFDNEIISQKIKGKIYEWHWDEITKCVFCLPPKFLGMPFIIPPIIKIITNDDYRILTFAYSRRREKILLNICPNERIKVLLKKAFNE